MPMQNAMDNPEIELGDGDALELLTEVSEITAENAIRLLRRFSVVSLDLRADE